MLMRAMVFVAVVQSCCLATTALGAELLANFDSFPEGTIGTEFTDGGITFSELDVALPGPPFQFIIEDASFNPWTNQSLPNVLISTGFAPGPGHGLGRFRSMTITFPEKASRASIDVFTSRLNNDKILTLSALLNDVAVATTSRLLPDGTEIGPSVVYHELSITATQFNKLRLFVTTLEGTPDYTVIAWDNVRIQLVPEPQSFLLLQIGVMGLLAKHGHRARAS